MKTFKELTEATSGKIPFEDVAKTIDHSNKPALGAFSDGIAVIEQKLAKKWQVVFKADKADNNEFGKGMKNGDVLVRLETPLSKPNSFEHRTIAIINVLKGTIKFADMEKYEGDSTVKWERGLKFKFLNIHDSELGYFGVF